MGNGLTVDTVIGVSGQGLDATRYRGRDGEFILGLIFLSTVGLYLGPRHLSATC